MTLYPYVYNWQCSLLKSQSFQFFHHYCYPFLVFLHLHRCYRNFYHCAVDCSGNPLFLEPFWMQNAASSTVLVSGWHRMGYSYDNRSSISKELEKYIRKLHFFVGNAVTEKRFIVFGAGSTQLLNAAVHALALDNSTSPARVVDTFPFYPVLPLPNDLLYKISFWCFFLYSMETETFRKREKKIWEHNTTYYFKGYALQRLPVFYFHLSHFNLNILNSDFEICCNMNPSSTSVKIFEWK